MLVGSEFVDPVTGAVLEDWDKSVNSVLRLYELLEEAGNGIETKDAVWGVGYFQYLQSRDHNNYNSYKLTWQNGKTEFIHAFQTADGPITLLFASQRSIYVISRFFFQNNYENIITLAPESWAQRGALGDQLTDWNNGIELYEVIEEKL